MSNACQPLAPFRLLFSRVSPALPRTGLLLVLLLLIGAPVQAQNFYKRYGITTPGGMCFVGNTLGLSKAAGSNLPGTKDSIGIFTSLDPTQQAAGWPQATYGPTTNSYFNNGSTSDFEMPAGSSVLRAELVWGGTQISSTQSLTNAEVNIPVTLGKYLAGTQLASTSVSYDPATQFISVGSRQYYVHSADVTSFVQANGTGMYGCLGVPSTISPGDDNSNCCGWTLCVIYQNYSLPIRNMTIYVGAQINNSGNSGSQTAIALNGFCTAAAVAHPKTRMLVSAYEGDASITGDQLLFGPSSGSLVAVSGAGNPIGNFFGGQLNTGYDGSFNQNGSLSTSGTAGTRNESVGSPGVDITGGRQGMDITNIDVSAEMSAGQQTAYFRGTSSGDEYTITNIGVQIDVGAPAFPVQVKTVDKAVTYVGDTLTYTVSLDNSTGTADANNVVFSDPVPNGTSFVPNTFTYDGATVTGADPNSGVNLGVITAGTKHSVTFKVLVNAIPQSPLAPSFANVAKWSYQFSSCAFGAVNNVGIATNQVVTTVPRLSPSKTVTSSTGGVGQGSILTYTITVPNDGSADSAGTTLADPIPGNTTYVPGSTTLNGNAVPDNGGQAPYATAAAINSPSGGAGVIKQGETATIVFRVLIPTAGVVRVGNFATVDPDGPGPAPTQPFGVFIPTFNADLGVTIVHNGTPASGGPITYVATVINNGPQTVNSYTLQLSLPAGLTGVSYAPSAGTYNPTNGLWTNTLASSGQVTLTVTGTLPGTATGSVTATANVTTPVGVTDPVSSNNTASDTTALAGVADLSLVKTSNQPAVPAGGIVTYQLTVTNLGPSTVTDLFLNDPLPSALQNPTYKPSQGVFNSSSGQITGLNLVSGQSTLLTITAQVKTGSTGTIVNTATVSDDPNITDPVSGNNTSSASITVGYTITGRVYLDANADAAYDTGDSGYSGPQVYVKLLSGGVVTAVATPAADGSYTLPVAATGNYTVFIDTSNSTAHTTAATPAGYVNTEASTGSLTEVLNNNLTGVNFGLYAGSRITGTVFRDDGAGGGTANNGVKDGGETGLGGATVTARTADGVTTFGSVVDTAGNFTAYIPASAGTASVELVESPPANNVSTGGQIGTTGGTYSRTGNSVTWNFATGNNYTGVSFGNVPSDSFTTDGNQIATPGGTVLYSHLFTAGTAGTFDLSATSVVNPQVNGWNYILYWDKNANGVIDAGEPQITAPIPVTAGQQIAVLVKVFVPQGAPANDYDKISLTSTFTYANITPTATDVISHYDLTTVQSGNGLILTKSVNKATAKPGDQITYTVVFRNSSTTAISNLVINDETPAYTTFVSATNATLPTSLTGVTLANPGAGNAGPVSWTFAGTLEPGSTGTVSFVVQLK